MLKQLLVTLMTIGVIVLLIGCGVSNQSETASQTIPDTLPSITNQPSPAETFLVNDVPSTDNFLNSPPNEDPIGEPALPSLVVFGGYSEFRELHDLLDQDDKSIEEYLNSDGRYFPNGLRTRMDIENLFVSLHDLHFPCLEGIEAASTQLAIGYVENGHAAEVPVYIVFEVNGVNYVFVLNASSNWGNRPGPTAADIIGNWDAELDGLLELLRDEGDVSVYYWQRTDDGRVVFIIDVKGVYTLATVHNTEDVPSAIDGLLRFDFRPLLESSDRSQY